MRALRHLAVLALGLSSSLGAQSLADRIERVRDGTVRLTYASRPGLCGDGETFIRDMVRDNYMTMESSSSRRGWRSRPCEEGPARVAIFLDGGMITRAKLYVGGEWRAGEGVTDLGLVAAARAAEAFISLAERHRRADGLIFAATAADSSEVWPDLLRLAKNDRAPSSSRKNAVFWLSQYAGDAATRGLTELVDDDTEDREVREQAVFALSQLPRDQGVPVLIRVARTNRDPGIRRKALFWLGQSDDPRVLRLFEEILTRG